MYSQISLRIAICHQESWEDYLKKPQIDEYWILAMLQEAILVNSLNIISRISNSFICNLPGCGDCITILKENFPDAVVGLSDHTENIYTSVASIALGASIIEKHFTDSKNRKGPDISSSMDPSELKELIKATKEVYLSRGNTKKPLMEEKKTIDFAFASVAAIQDIIKGEILNSKNIFPLRPNSGYFKVKDYKRLIGRKAKNDIKKGFQLRKNDV